MTIAWYDPTNHHVSTDKHDPLFTPLGQLWPLDVQRTWVGLTDDEIDHFCQLAYTGDEELVLTIQARLKEKNT
jgi:hypothetical protein